MDSQKFGDFLCSLRKEKGWTQQELAEQLHVTDKAVSKWERGAGFPDIKMLEPLADALDVSVLELMQSERIDKPTVPTEQSAEAVQNMMELSAVKQKMMVRNEIIVCLLLAGIGLLVFTIDSMSLLGFVMVCLPLISFGVGIFLLGLSVWRKRRKLKYAFSLIIGILAVCFPIAVLLFLCMGVAMGWGPVPS